MKNSEIYFCYKKSTKNIVESINKWNNESFSNDYKIKLLLFVQKGNNY